MLIPEWGHWLPVLDGDKRVSALYRRHYSAYEYADGRHKNLSNPYRHLVVGVGQRMVLLSADSCAAFIWRFSEYSHEAGVECSFFRNEGAYGGTVLSSELILEAEQLAILKWDKATRFFTYVNPRLVRGDGLCFKKAGWKKVGRSKKQNLLILEKVINN